MAVVFLRIEPGTFWIQIRRSATQRWRFV